MAASPFQIEFESAPRGTVAHVLVCGEKSLNVVDKRILGEANCAFQKLLEHENLRCITLTGPTDKAFIGGANLNALHALNAATAESFIRSVHDFCALLRSAPIPVVAVLRGYCLGAGLEIAAACDMRIGDRSVYCGMPEVRVGLPSVVEAALLPGLVGWGKARELMLRGNIIDADEALAIGLLQHVVESSALIDLRKTICDDIVASGPLAVAAQKRLFTQWEEQPLSAAIESGVHALVEAYGSDEPQIAIKAFFARSGKTPAG